VTHKPNQKLNENTKTETETVKSRKQNFDLVAKLFK